MKSRLEISNLSYSINNKEILKNINFTLEQESFAVLLGENGSGKSTLLDLIMGFRKAQQGEIKINGISPLEDSVDLKKNVLFLSEKMEAPIYWRIKDYLSFHKHFFPTYSDLLEKKLMQEYGLQYDTSFRSLSAGENKRAQIIAALSSQPKILFVDEITAVLDIVGRQRFMGHLKELKENGALVLMATNIIEDLEHYASHLLLLRQGQLQYSGKMSHFNSDKIGQLFTQKIVKELEAA